MQERSIADSAAGDSAAAATIVSWSTNGWTGEPGQQRTSLLLEEPGADGSAVMLRRPGG